MLTWQSDRPCGVRQGFAAETIPGLFLQRCGLSAGKVAIRQKRGSIYHEITWGEYLRNVEDLCLGLVELGLRKGDRLAILGDVCPEWMYADLAAQAAGGISVGIYPSCSQTLVRSMLVDAGARFLVAQGREYLEKVMIGLDKLPALEHIVVVNTLGVSDLSDHRIVTYQQVAALGQEKKAKEPRLFESLVAALSRDDIANLVYTPGTTDQPKAVKISHYNWLWGYLPALEEFGQLANQKNRVVCSYTLAHVMGRLYGQYAPLLLGFPVFIPPNDDMVQETLFDVAPTVFFGSPRNYRNISSRVLTRIEGTTRLERAVCQWALASGRKYLECIWERGKAPMHLKLAHLLGRAVAFRAILDKFGLARVRLAFVCGGALSSDVIALFQVLGINLLEGYLTVETGPVSSQRGSLPRPGNVGKPYRQAAVTLSDEGEVLVKGPACTSGYWKDEAATRGTIVDGWVHTGDIGCLHENGDLELLGRLGDAVTHDGRRVFTQALEKAIKSSPFVCEAVAIPRADSSLCCLVEVDAEVLADWARRHAVSYTSYASLSEDPAVHRLIEAEIRRLNATLDSMHRAQSFRLISKELDPEDEGDLVTPNGKVKRKALTERFADLIRAMEEECAQVGE